MLRCVCKRKLCSVWELLLAEVWCPCVAEQLWTGRMGSAKRVLAVLLQRCCAVVDRVASLGCGWMRL